MAVPTSNTGALRWEQALENAVTSQRSIPILAATPESVVYAPPGYQVATTAGNTYVKTSTADLATGWKLITHA